MYSAVQLAEPMEQKTSVMKKMMVVGLFVGCLCMAFFAGTKVSTANEANMLVNVDTGMAEGVKADEYLWIIANAKSAFEGILSDPNNAVNWDKVAKAYCNVVKMYCAYVPQCNDQDGCRPEDIRTEWNYFCKEGPLDEEGQITKSMKYKACNHLDYVNGPGGAR